jgi:hypothetical protein
MKWQIAACTKSEGPNLLEWCCYHILKGAEKITLYDFDHEENSKRLAGLINVGRVEIIPWTIYPAQWQAYSDFIKKNSGYLSMPIAFIDADEFICTPAKVTVAQVLSQMPEHSAGLGIGWRIFGSSGHEKRPEGLVIENYTRRVNYDKNYETFTKCIVNPRFITAEVNDPHIFFPKPGKEITREDGIPLRWGDHHHRKPEPFPMSKIWLNHYFTKSREDFMIKYNRRGPDGAQRKLDGLKDFILPVKELIQCYST